MNDDELRERLKEIAANIYLAKVAIHSVDNPQIIDDALSGSIRDLDNLIDEMKETN